MACIQEQPKALPTQIQESANPRVITVRDM